MGTALSFDTLVIIYQLTRCHTPRELRIVTCKVALGTLTQFSGSWNPNHGDSLDAGRNVGTYYGSSQRGKSLGSPASLSQ